MRKQRYRGVIKAAKDWEKRAGVDALSESVEQARAELYAPRKALGTVKLQSVADAAAYAREHRWPSQFRDQHHAFDRGLPFSGVRFFVRQLVA